MALEMEQVSATPQALEYRPRGREQARALKWARLRSLTARVDPAWSGAEISVSLAFAGENPPANGAPLADGRRVEVFGDLPAARRMMAAAQARSSQALVGPLAALLFAIPEPDGDDEQWYRRKLKDYAFAAAAALSLGKRYLSLGRLLAAEGNFAAVVRRDPVDSQAWRWLGLTRLLAGKGRGAEAALDRLLALGARDTEAYLFHALSVYRQRRFDQAAQELDRVLREQPDNPTVRGLLACSLVQQSRIGEAAGELDRLAAGDNEGWKLMAQKCRICAEGYRVYRERSSRDRWFRWKERWKVIAGRIAAVIGGMLSMFQYFFAGRGWMWLLVIGTAGVLLYLLGRGRLRHQQQDQLADARGEVANMPCWYASLVWGRNRPGGSGQSIAQQIEERLGAD